MVINAPSELKSADIEFISYTGRWPNLCSGELTLKINGEIAVFGYTNNCQYGRFWSSGGSCGFSSDYSDSYITSDEWKIDVNDLPEKFRPFAKDLDEVFNSNVRYGCCGGCL